MTIYEAERNWREALTGVNATDGVWLRYGDEWVFVPDNLTAEEYLREARSFSNEQVQEMFGLLRCQNCGTRYHIGEILQWKTCPVYYCRGWLFRAE